MPLLNALSVPRGLAMFPRKWLRSACLTADSVGDCVFITSNKVGSLYQVTKADPSDQTKMPATGVIVYKYSATECKVQFLGEVAGIYTSLPLRKPLFVGSDSRLTDAPPIPILGGYAFSQVMGSVVDQAVFTLVPNFLMVKRVG